MYFYDQPLHQLIKTNINNMIYQHQLIVNLYVHNLFHFLDQQQNKINLIADKALWAKI